MYPVEKISSQNTYPLVWHSNCHHIGITGNQQLYPAHQLIVSVNVNLFKWGWLIWMSGLVGSGIEYIFACWKSNRIWFCLLQIEAYCRKKNLNSQSHLRNHTFNCGSHQYSPIWELFVFGSMVAGRSKYHLHFYAVVSPR